MRKLFLALMSLISLNAVAWSPLDMPESYDPGMIVGSVISSDTIKSYFYTDAQKFHRGGYLLVYSIQDVGSNYKLKVSIDTRTLIENSNYYEAWVYYEAFEESTRRKHFGDENIYSSAQRIRVSADKMRACLRVIVDYDEDGNVIGNFDYESPKWSYIVPDSFGAEIYEMISIFCTSKTMFQTLVDEYFKNL